MTVLASLLCLVLLPLTACARDDEERGATRILVLGDSLSQGRAGDWTWRYRLAQHLSDVGADVDFVGPRRGVPETTDAGATWPETDLYVDPEFDSEHASRWGQSATWLETPPDELVEDFHPDVVVLALGTNDLAYAHETPEQTVDLLGAVIENFRAADAAVDVVAMGVPVAEQPGSTVTNDLLAGRVDAWDSDTSRVVLAPADRYYGPSTTWDGVHPNAAGDWALARAVADGLAELGVGEPMAAPSTDDVAEAERRQVAAPSLAVSVGDGEAYLRWSQTEWADHYRVLFRDVTAGQGEMTERGEVEGTAERVSGLVNGHVYEFAVEPGRGPTGGGLRSRSPVVEAVPTAPALPSVALAPTVTGVDGAVALSWAPAPGVPSYRVWYRRTGEGGGGW
ncbi:MAG: GDSL-type esterase/lipase family protein, partial [Nocardioides sp.]|uniref:SGNH/GDSL hydrolase family protein n=1 Tax=Nocardioides sp. TaxID=35761 RepID=UPI003F0ECE59